MSLLSGIRVVEMGLWVAGPSAGGILADWGAEVVKLEMPTGDPMRTLYSALSGSKESRCPPFDLHNRGKRSVALDVNLPEGRALAQRLVSTADVFLSNMRPQFLRRAGLDHETLLAMHPKLVYGILTGYGLDGPDKDAPGFDMAAFSARSGISHRATPPGGVPPTLPGGMGDNVTAIALVAGILGALVNRQRTGRGQLVSTSLLRTGMFCASMELSAFLALGKVMPPPSRTRPQNPLMNSYRASDGKWLWLIGAEADRHWEPIVNALGAAELQGDERFATSRDRRRNAEALVAIFDEIFARHTRDEWAALLTQHGVWWSPVNSFDDLLSDAQARACGALVEMPSIAGDGTTQGSLATPLDFGGESVAPLSAPPQLGSDTTEILRELGVGDGEFARLREARVIA
ncbi:MAG TPA: CoA transferase [Casimicrobiaceae bacterium]|nr:CoA transferase [Casimicrobiaceae bacterium]